MLSSLQGGVGIMGQKVNIQYIAAIPIFLSLFLYFCHIGALLCLLLGSAAPMVTVILISSTAIPKALFSLWCPVSQATASLRLEGSNFAQLPVPPLVFIQPRDRMLTFTTINENPLSHCLMLHSLSVMYFS